MSSEKMREPFLSVIYEQYLDDEDSAGFATRVAQFYSPGTLERLVEHSRREIRRASVLALGLLGDYQANHCLGRALVDDDRTVRILAENALRLIWRRDGDEAERNELAMIIRLNEGRQYQEVIRRASALLERAPWFAEPWHQRAEAHFHLHHFAEAVRDGHEALEINPYHFLAAARMGQAYLELGNNVSALESFRRALRLNPDLEAVRSHVVRLARMVEGT